MTPIPEPCEHLDCRAARVIARRIAEFIQSDPEAQAGIDIIREEDACSTAVALALVMNSLAERVAEMVLDDALAAETAKVDSEWEDLDRRPE